MRPSQFDDWMAHELAAVEAALDAWVPAGAPAGLGEAMRYAVLGGGKRVRPLLAYAAGEVAGYSRITVWPDRSAAELAGAMRADLQGRGQGGPGMAHSFGWIFETLGVRLMCLTAALDNIRVQKGIDGAGFVRVAVVQPDERLELVAQRLGVA